MTAAQERAFARDFVRISLANIAEACDVYIRPAPPLCNAALKIILDQK